MNFTGWLFWFFTWGIVITLVIYCYGKIIRKNHTAGNKNQSQEVKKKDL